MTRPLPSVAEPDTGCFWRATAEHRLTYQACNACAEVVFFPRAHCPACGSADLAERDSAGRGVVYSCTVVRTHHDPYFRARVPFVIGLIDLNEGFRLLTEIAACEDDVRIGTRVVVEWEDHEQLSLPLFRLERPRTDRLSGSRDKGETLWTA